MRHAETVTFGGSGLDRAAHIRPDAAEIARLRSDVRARSLPLWRGKPLIAPDGPAWVAPDDPALADARAEIFLGFDDHSPRFAVDISGWAPEATDKADPFHDPAPQKHPGLGRDAAFAELRGVMSLLAPRQAELAATARGLLEWHRSHGYCARCGAASRPACGGWQRDCPACGARHFPRTDPVVIMLVTHGNDVLLGRSPGWPDRMFSLLAGFVEPGETVEAAVRRETFEEAGIRVGEVGYLASQPWPFPASLMIGCNGTATSREIKTDPVEIEDARWVAREELAAVFRGEHASIAPARQGAIAHFLLSNWLADRLD